MLVFRDTLVTDSSAKRHYERVKRGLASRQWLTMKHYADAKSNVIDDILRDFTAEHGGNRSPDRPQVT